jgi:hypothetical protein
MIVSNARNGNADHAAVADCVAAHLMSMLVHSLA